MATEFKRGLSDAKLQVLRQLRERRHEAHWWNDLLDRWAPSGAPSGPEGLRLAVRDGYLNFYRRGQSVGRVGFGRGLTNPPAYVEVHAAYVHGRGNGTDYVRFGEGHRAYTAGSVAEWIGNSAYKHGPEKWGVDEIVGRNPGVIDLEMALPGAGPGGSALRVDIVAIEQTPDGPRVVLWEAKPLDAGALRKAPLQEREAAADIQLQTQSYRAYLEQRQSRIADAYRAHLRTLVEIAAMAGHELPCAKYVTDAQLAIEPRIGLALFRGVRVGENGERSLVPYSAATWETHRAKLHGIPICEADDPADLILALPTTTREVGTRVERSA